MSRPPKFIRMSQEEWRDVLLGTHPGLYRHRNWFKLLPAEPRCKLCNAPFHGVGGAVMSAIGRGQYSKNPHFCEACLAEPVEGTEVEITMLFADVRGSTGLAETMGASDFGALMKRFYAAATKVIVQSDGVLDKFVGDEVIGLYIPGFSGAEHARLAIQAAQTLLRVTGHRDPSGPWAPLGVGVHTGSAHVALVESAGGVGDLTALGDAMNITARLASMAGVGEVLVTQAAYDAAGLAQPAEFRDLELKGRAEPVRVRVFGPAA